MGPKKPRILERKKPAVNSVVSNKVFNNNDDNIMVEAANLKKHLGLAEKSFITLSQKDQAKVGGRLKKLLHTVADGAFLPLMNFCLEKCQVRIICALKGIKTDELSSSLKLKVEDVKKEEPKEGPKDEVKEEPIDSDVDERMAEANADIEAQVWNTMDEGHGNDKEKSECVSRPQQYQLQLPPKHQDYDHHQVVYQHHPQQQPPPHVHYVAQPRVLQNGQKIIANPPPRGAGSGCILHKASGQPVRIVPLQGARPVTVQPHQQDVRHHGGGVVRQWQQG